MKENLPASENFELFVLLLKTRHAIFRARVKELAKYKISPEHSLILASIAEFDENATTIKISRNVFREFHTVFAQLNIMEKEGLVRRIKDFPRKNRSRFELTEKGWNAYHQSTQRISINKIMSILSKEERQQLYACLDKLLGAALRELNLKHFKHQ